MQRKNPDSTTGIIALLKNTAAEQDNLTIATDNNINDALDDICYVRPAPPVKNRVIPTTQFAHLQKTYDRSQGKYVLPADEQQDVLIFNRK